VLIYANVITTGDTVRFAIGHGAVCRLASITIWPNYIAIYRGGCSESKFFQAFDWRCEVF
jgi:hypothetical protein